MKGKKKGRTPQGLSAQDSTASHLRLGADSAASQHPHPQQHFRGRLFCGVRVVVRCVFYRLRLLWQRLVRRRIASVADLPDELAAKEARTPASEGLPDERAAKEPSAPASEGLHPHHRWRRHHTLAAEEARTPASEGLPDERAAEEPRAPASEGLLPHHRSRHHHTFKPERLRPSVARPSLMMKAEKSPPATPASVVNGYCVSKEIEAQYKEYCRLSTLVPVNSVLCHMCFFEMQRHENCTVLKSKILCHCGEMHTIGIECKVAGCKVRVPTLFDRDLHMHFCHTNVS